MLLRYSTVPDGFGYGVVIPLVKNTEGNQFATDNYRSITISPVISEIFEMVIMRSFDDLLTSVSIQTKLELQSCLVYVKNCY